MEKTKKKAKKNLVVRVKSRGGFERLVVASTIPEAMSKYEKWIWAEQKITPADTEEVKRHFSPWEIQCMGEALM